ncbi:MAG: PF20097 family protein [Emergencia sp.]
MKCPFCQEEMESGYVQSSHQIMWGKDKNDTFFMPDKNKDEFYISKGIWKGSFTKAEYCNKCKRIIISLEKE